VYFNRRGEPISAKKWSRTLGNERVRRVALYDDGVVAVSTVWLGLDHNYSGSGPPLIFETMVYGGVFDREQERYATEAQALVGHHRWVSNVLKTRKETN
jgi:hypothetical protein